MPDRSPEEPTEAPTKPPEGPEDKHLDYDSRDLIHDPGGHIAECLAGGFCPVNYAGEAACDVAGDRIGNIDVGPVNQPCRVI